MTQRSVPDAVTRGFDLLSQNFVPLFMIGVVGEVVNKAIIFAMEFFAVNNIAGTPTLEQALKMFLNIVIVCSVLVILFFLFRALMWGAISEALAVARRRETPSWTAAIAQAGSKFRLYLRSYGAFLVPAMVVESFVLLGLPAVMYLAYAKTGMAPVIDH